MTITDIANPQTMKVSLVITASADTRTWVGQGNDNLWSDPREPGWYASLHLSGDTNCRSLCGRANSSSVYDLPAGVVLNSLILTGSNVRIGGGALNVSNTIDASEATGSNTIQASVNLVGKVEVLAGSSQLTFAAPINLNANSLTVDAGLRQGHREQHAWQEPAGLFSPRGT